MKSKIPAIIIHPGEILQDEIEARGIKQKSLAKLIGVQPTYLNEVIKGKRDFNAGLCLLIGAALDMDAEIWHNLQCRYEMEQAMQDEEIQERLRKFKSIS